jgi:hypothetical protein
MTKLEMQQTKSAWVSWLATYGADKFFDAFMANAQNALSTCVHCGEEIYLDIAEGGGVPDWSSNDELGGDYGCLHSPDTTEEGTGGHFPRRREQ